MTQQRRYFEIERIDRELEDTGDGGRVLVRAEHAADLSRAGSRGHRGPAGRSSSTESRTSTMCPSVAPANFGRHRVTALRPAAIRVGARRPRRVAGVGVGAQARPARIATGPPCDVAFVTVPNDALLCALTNRPVIVHWRRLARDGSGMNDLMAVLAVWAAASRPASRSLAMCPMPPRRSAGRCARHGQLSELATARGRSALRAARSARAVATSSMSAAMVGLPRPNP